jgi:hypothetical protein
LEKLRIQLEGVGCWILLTVSGLRVVPAVEYQQFYRFNHTSDFTYNQQSTHLDKLWH